MSSRTAASRVASYQLMFAVTLFVVTAALANIDSEITSPTLTGRWLCSRIKVALDVAVIRPEWLPMYACAVDWTKVVFSEKFHRAI